MHGWGLLQLLVIINYLVLFIEYALKDIHPRKKNKNKNKNNPKEKHISI
jgi:hypothetical protein